MKNYKVEIVETLSRVVEQEAESYEDAQDLVEEKYSNDEIELDYRHLEGTEYKRYPYQNIKDNFNLSIDFDKESNDMYISLEGSSGARYDCKTINDLKLNINDFISNYIELEEENNDKMEISYQEVQQALLNTFDEMYKKDLADRFNKSKKQDEQENNKEMER